jgi:hypothetical protein
MGSRETYSRGMRDLGVRMKEVEFEGGRGMMEIGG